MAAPLAGKVALITGGSKGIGARTAVHLASLGANVAINYSSDAKPAEEVVAEINKTSKGLAIKGDAGSVAGVEAIVKAVVDSFGKIDLLIANAGMMLMRDTEATSEADFDRMFALNVKGPYFLVQKAVPYMPKGSSVVLISTSVNNLSGVMPGYLLYCATKGAIEQMNRVMAKDLGRKGIAVNCIAPGPTATELFFNGKTEQMVKALENMSPYQRIGQPDEIAGAIGLLCRGEASWVNGQMLRVNGGMN